MNKDDQRTLDGLRSTLGRTLAQFQEVLSHRMDRISRKEMLLFGIDSALQEQTFGTIEDEKRRKKLAARATPDRTADTLQVLSGELSSNVDGAIGYIQHRERKVRATERKVLSSRRLNAPGTRLSLFSTIQCMDPYKLKRLLLCRILRDRNFNVPALYGMVGAEMLTEITEDFYAFRLRVHHALGEGALPDGVVHIIHGYYAYGMARNIPWRLTMSSTYGGLPNNYATLTDGRHGYPGAATNSGGTQWIEARFEDPVFPQRLLLSEPTHGAFAQQQWRGGTLLRGTVIVVPKEVKSRDEPRTPQVGDQIMAPWSGDGVYYQARITQIHENDTCDIVFYDGVSQAALPVVQIRPVGGSRHDAKAWDTVGRVESAPGRDGLITVRLTLSRSSRVFRLVNTRGNYIATGTLEFE